MVRALHGLRASDLQLPGASLRLHGGLRSCLRLPESRRGDGPMTRGLLTFPQPTLADALAAMTADGLDALRAAVAEQMGADR